MREIKFRGIQSFGTFKGRMIFGSVYFSLADDAITDGFVCTISQPNTMPIYVDPATVGQFIGIIDEDGAEVYEGDTITCSMSFEGGSLPHMGEVVYMEEFGAFATRNESGDTLLHNHQLNTFKVVGNVHESLES